MSAEHGPAPEAPRRLGPYRVESTIGRGGMGEVYRARHVETGALHAVKVILARRLVGDEGRRTLARFQNEVEVLARVRHPGIVTIHAAGVDDGVPWCSMDLVDGRSLAELTRTGPLPPREAARIVAAVARAIAHIHELGVVHRDLKPGNVIIEDDGEQPRVVDFGLAYDAFAEELTRTGDIVGTPAFLAPEQLIRGASRVGPSADIYGLGIILYGCLTARPPFRGANQLATLTEVLRAPPPPPGLLDPGVPAALDAICLRALEKRPGDRYATAVALAEDLERFLDGGEVLAASAGRWTRLRAWLVPRTRAGRLGSALVLALALVGAFEGARFLLQPGRLLGSPLARVEAYERRLARDGRLSAEVIREVEAIGQHAGLSEQHLLAQRARLLAGLAEEAALPPDAPVDVFRVDVLRGALRLPDRREHIVAGLLAVGRLATLHDVLTGRDPPTPAPIEAAAPLARFLADPAAAAGRLPPLHAPAFDALVRAPGLERAIRGRLRVARAERWIGLGDAAAFDSAVDDLHDAATLDATPPSAACATAAFHVFLIERFLATIESDAPEARRLGDLIVRCRPADAVVPAPLIDALRAVVGVDHALAAGRDVATIRTAAAALLVGPVLESLEEWPFEAEMVATLRDAVGVERLRDEASREARLPPARRNPARLLFAVELLGRALDDAERDALLEGARDSGVDASWLHSLVGRRLAIAGRDEDARAALERAVELDRARPDELRGSWAPVRLAALLARDDPDRAPLLLEAARVEEASWARDVALERTGVLRGWRFRQARRIGAELVVLARQEVAEGVPACCGEGRRDPDAMIERAARILGLPLARMLNLFEGRDWIATPSSALLIRVRHHLGHGRVDAALGDVDRILGLESAEIARRDYERRGVWRAIIEAFELRAEALELLGRSDQATAARAEARRHREGAGL